MPSHVSSICFLRKTSILHGNPFRQSFQANPWHELVLNSPKPVIMNVIFMLQKLCHGGPGGVSILTRAPLSKLEGNFTYHLFADIPVLEKNNALAFPGFIRTKLFGESLSPIFYVAAALITFR